MHLLYCILSDSERGKTNQPEKHLTLTETPGASATRRNAENMTDAELLQHWMSRQDGGLTQAQAAERLGLTQSGVNQVLKGKCNLSEVGRKFIAHLISDLDAPTPEPQVERKRDTINAYSRQGMDTAYPSGEYDAYHDVITWIRKQQAQEAQI